MYFQTGLGILVLCEIIFSIIMRMVCVQEEWGDSYMSLRDSSAGNQCGCVEASYKDSTVQKVKTQ